MNESKHQRQSRGIGFPILSLSEAARMLTNIATYGFEHSAQTLASLMGHKTTNSSSFRQRVAAFRDWGLLTGRGDRLTMTDTARMIAMPTSSDARQKAMQASFLHCEIFSRLHEEIAKGRNIDRDGLKGQAVNRFSVSPQRVDKFVDSFIESALAAGMARHDDQGQLVLLELSSESVDDEAVELEQATGEPSPEPGPSPITTVQLTDPGLQTPAVHQSWQIDGGEIVFIVRTGRALPSTSFAEIGEIVRQLEKLAASLNVEGVDKEIEGEQ